jgi:hypothetical protein
MRLRFIRHLKNIIQTGIYRTKLVSNTKLNKLVMEDLIKALQIFLKYGNPYSPCHCEHDYLYIDINPELVSAEDIEQLDNLGFFIDAEYGGRGFGSYRFGSC